jgi:hypothetical protein
VSQVASRRFIVALHGKAIARDPGFAETDREPIVVGGFPALPTAMTTRSQLASSPAIAVFSGEATRYGPRQTHRGPSHLAVIIMALSTIETGLEPGSTP